MYHNVERFDGDDLLPISRDNNPPLDAAPDGLTELRFVRMAHVFDGFAPKAKKTLTSAPPSRAADRIQPNNRDHCSQGSADP
jgi:hypothetical protein